MQRETRTSAGTSWEAIIPAIVHFCLVEYKVHAIITSLFNILHPTSFARRHAMRAKHTMTIPALVIAGLFILSSAASGSVVEGVHFPGSLRAGDHELALRGVSLKRYLHFVKVSVAGLYLPENVPSARVLSDTPKRLEIEYLQNIRAQDFVKLTNRLLADNLDAAELSRLQPRIDALNAAYEDIRAGDRYALTYVPGRGTELTLNGVSRGIFEGEDFAAAVFSMWLGPRPLSESVKSQLLGFG